MILRVLAIGGNCVAVPLVPKQTRATVAPAPDAPKRQVTRREMVGIAISVVATMFGFQAYRWWTSDSTVATTHLPAITPIDLDKAKNLWREQGPKDYNLEMTFVAPATSADLRLEVRDGLATRLQKKGIETKRADELAQWTVEGQFEQIAKYLTMDMSTEAKNAGWTMVNVGEFDKTYGYPKEYSRQGTGHQTKYHITVTKFERVNP
jgi:hypothetical protein